LWIRQIGEAVAEAHASGVLHRDLKPGNILIERMGLEREQAVVVDFGAATLAHEPDGETSMHLGSFDYMPPERVLGRSFPSGDVYGLAAIAFELLTGVKYAGVAASSVDGMKRLLAAVPGEAAEILAIGLAYSPEERTSDIRQFAIDLSEALKTPGDHPHRPDTRVV
jgi:serine/threonine-protein kinase